MTKTLLIVVMFLGLFAAFGNHADPLPVAAVIVESYTTQRNEGDNLDSPALWHGPHGQHWLMATAKWTDQVVVFDATNGAVLKRFGESGVGPGQLKRPNSIAVVDTILFVVERDNARIQVLTLPDFRHIAFVGVAELRWPYGIAVVRSGPAQASLYVTDNYEPEYGLSVGERVKHFRVHWEEQELLIEYVGAFGDTTGPGVLHKVESIAADAEGGRLLIADEAQVDIKVYDLDGAFTGKVLGRGILRSEPEGIALKPCGDGTGYWIATDQSPTDNVFHLLDRQTLEHVAAFSGKTTRRTDGIAVTSVSFDPFENGAFFAADSDSRLAAFDWQRIAAASGFKARCGD